MSSSDDMLKKMRDKDKDKTPPSPEDLYTRLIVYHQRRSLLTLVSIGFGVFCFALLTTGRRHHQPWLVAALPIAAVGLIIGLVPPTEEWDYKPWQTKPRQYEHHHAERR
jgi:hypothetical protein